METYWITGTQLAILKALVSPKVQKHADKVIDEIVEEQQVANDVQKLTLK